MSISAEVHTDDHTIKIYFDATQWFKQASKAEIAALIECGFGGDTPADEVAITSAKWFNEIDSVFNHVNPLKDMGGFECNVDEDDARAWLKNERSMLKKLLACF